jgi:hypothetical protein
VCPASPAQPSVHVSILQGDAGGAKEWAAKFSAFSGVQDRWTSSRGTLKGLV